MDVTCDLMYRVWIFFFLGTESYPEETENKESSTKGKLLC